MRNYTETCKGTCSYNLVYNFSIQLLPLKSLVFVVHFLIAFWHENKAFPKKNNSQHEIVPPLVVFHLPYTKYKDVKICFYSCRYQNQNFSLMSHLCRQDFYTRTFNTLFYLFQLCKSMDWFLYDNGLRHERVKLHLCSLNGCSLFQLKK